MELNPFLCNTYRRYWEAHFAVDSPVEDLHMIPGLGFVKTSHFPVWQNTGGTLTKGITYKIISGQDKDLDKVLVIYDVPSIFPADIEALAEYNLKTLVSSQYSGFLCDFKGYSHLQEYLKATLSSNSRAKLRYYKRKADRGLDISYHMFLSEISRETYDDLFGQFHTLLDKRFGQKKEFNVNLTSREWDFYRELTYPMMLEKKAGLFVTYDGQQPIAFTLLFIDGARLIDTIRVFDIEYSRYRVGSLSILALMNWCFENKFEILDFSKGDFEYKRRWANTPYNFDYHIIYNPKSIRLKTLAYSALFKFELKQYLRKLNFDFYFNRLKYYWSTK